MKFGKIGKGASSVHTTPPGFGSLIEIPTINDVLSGRGDRTNDHPGNIYFRQLVANFMDSYQDKNTMTLDKVKIIHHIVKMIRNTNPPGRFLEEDANSKFWKEIGDKEARKKVGKVMTEKATENRQILEERTISPIPYPEPNSSAHANLHNAAPMPVFSDSGAYVKGSHDLDEVGAYHPDRFNHVGSQMGEISCNSNVTTKINCVTNTNTTVTIPLDLPNEQLDTATQQPPCRPYSEILEKKYTEKFKDEPSLYTKEQHDSTLGTNGIVFGNTFSPLDSSGSTNQTDFALFGNLSPITLLTSSNETSISSSKESPNFASMMALDIESDSDDFKPRKRNTYLQLTNSNIAGATSFENELRKQYHDIELGNHEQFRNDDSERSCVPSQLIDQAPTLTSRRSLTGSMRDMNLSLEILNQDSNNSDLCTTDKSMFAELNTFSGGNILSSNSSDMKNNRRERLNTDTSSDAMSFQIERRKSDNSSSDIMSLESKISTTSAWLSTFKGMHGLPPGGDLCQRFSSETSRWSIFSEISTDM